MPSAIPVPVLLRPATVSRAALLLAALLLAPWLALTAGCGPDPRTEAVEAYRVELRALLDDEARLWRQIQERGAVREEQPIAFVRFLTGTARPFYRSFEERLADLEPVHADLEHVHGLFVEFAGQRLAWIAREETAVDVVRRAVADEGLSRLTLLQAEAEADRREYARLVDRDDPRATYDHRYTKLSELAELAARLHDDLDDGTLEVGEVQSSVRVRILPVLGELRGQKLPDGEVGRALGQALATAQQYYEQYVESLPLLMESRRATDPAAEALRRSEQLRRRAVAQLRNLR